MTSKMWHAIAERLADHDESNYICHAAEAIGADRDAVEDFLHDAIPLEEWGIVALRPDHDTYPDGYREAKVLLCLLFAAMTPAERAALKGEE